ncbi:hypothetical protein HYT55_03010 [Candidatus Woesearchaeota archaeon]|nr:hypothetical protein [Candidatus Woesearchaeota archaeon]
MELTLEDHFQEFAQRYAIPTADIKTGIEDYYRQKLTGDFLRYTWPECRQKGLTHSTSREAVEIHFEAIYFDYLKECAAIAEVSGIPIPKEFLKVLREEAMQKNSPYLAFQVNLVEGGAAEIGEQVKDSPPRRELGSLAYLTSCREATRAEIERRGGIESVEREISQDKDLEHFLTTLPESPKEKRRLIQRQYHKLTNEDGCTWIAYVGDFFPFFGGAKIVYAATEEAPNAEIAHKVYQRLLQVENRGCGYMDGLWKYVNVFSGLLWLHEVSGIKPEYEVARGAFEQMANFAFHLDDPAPQFEMLEKITGLKARDVFAAEEKLQWIIPSVYRHALFRDNPGKVEVLERFTGIPASFTPEDYQEVYREMFYHTGNDTVGLAALCKRYNKWRIKPVDGFFVAFLENYAKLGVPTLEVNEDTEIACDQVT